MRTERTKRAKARQQPVLYTTLNEALQVKLEHSKQVLANLSPEARVRLTNEAKLEHEDLQSND